jgi:hypothetical protein
MGHPNSLVYRPSPAAKYLTPEMTAKIMEMPITQLNNSRKFVSVMSDTPNMFIETV